MSDINYCPGCGESVRAENEQLQQILKQAADYAQKEQTPVAIYKEGGEYRFCNAFTAYQNGYPVTRVVSHYSNLPTY